MRFASKRPMFRLAVLFVALVVGARAARADEIEVDVEAPEAPAQAQPEAPVQVQPDAPVQVQPDAPAQVQRMSWYGWQTLLVDGGAVGLFALALWADDAKYASGSYEDYQLASNVLLTASLAAYALGGPAIHWAHGHAQKGWGSLGLRLGLPVGGLIAGLLGGAAFCGSGNGGDDFIPCPVVAGVFGFLSGVVAAPIVDAGALAREPVMRPAAPSFQAAFVPSGGGGTLVLGGRF